MKKLQIRKIFNKFYINTNHDLKNTILVAGTGRSGTTWIANIINYRNEYRDIFEPFYPQHTREWHKFNYKHYLRADERSIDIIEAAEKILSGNIRNKWVDQYNRKFFCSRRIIKEIRINFLLKWIKKIFPDVPIIFVMRHPCAVAYSRMKLGWDHHLNSILDQKMLVNDFLADYISTIINCKTNFEKQIYLWCIENYVPLQQFIGNDLYIAYYEHFCTRPEEEICRLFKWLKKDSDNRVINAIRIPSAVVEKHSAILTGENLISSWKKKLKKTEVNNAIEILRMFGLHTVYDQSPMPKMQSGIIALRLN